LLAVVAGAPAGLLPGLATVAGPAHAAAAEIGTPTAAAPSQPYGGQLGATTPAPGGEDLFEAGLLGLGTLDAVGLVGAGLLDALRGPSPGATRQALMHRSGPGVVSERRADRSRPVTAAAAKDRGAHRAGMLRAA
jgi:hypothetical protein